MRVQHLSRDGQRGRENVQVITAKGRVQLPFDDQLGSPQRRTPPVTVSIHHLTERAALGPGS